MKKILFQICVICFFLPFLNAQTTKPFPTFGDKSTWNELSLGGSFSPFLDIVNTTFQFKADTMLCGKPYAMATNGFYNVFVRNQNNSTFLRTNKDCSIAEVKMYDFGDDLQQEGDFFDVPLLNGKKLAKLSKIDTPIINGIPRKRYELTFEDNKILKVLHWIQGIGCVEHPFYPLVQLDASDIPTYTLLCESENGKLNYQNTKYNTCYYKSSIKPFWEFSDNIVWSFLVDEISLPPYKDSLEYEKSEAICGYQYNKIVTKNAVLYVRNEGNKTFYRDGNNCSTPEYLLYDFDLKIGETKTIKHPYNVNINFTVVSIDSVYELGAYRKKIELDYIFEIDKKHPTKPLPHMTWIQGFGSDVHPFYPYHIYPQGVDQITFWEPLCYFKNSYKFYSNPNYINCEFRSAADFPFPTSKTYINWDVVETNFDDFPRSIYNYHIENPIKDTTICGRTFNKFETINNVLFYRNQGNQTLYFANKGCGTPDIPFYDMDLKIGQTLNVPSLYDTKTFQFKVTKIDSINTFPPRKRLYLSYSLSNGPFNLNMEWIDGIGSTEHPFYPLFPIWTHTLDGLKYDLTCAHQGQFISLYQNPKYSTCKISAIDDFNELENVVEVFPNPIDNNLNISVLNNDKKLKISISDLTGKQILSNSLFDETITLDMAFLPKGIFLVKIEDLENKKMCVKKIVK